MSAVYCLRTLEMEKCEKITVSSNKHKRTQISSINDVTSDSLPRQITVGSFVHCLLLTRLVQFVIKRVLKLPAQLHQDQEVCSSVVGNNKPTCVLTQYGFNVVQAFNPLVNWLTNSLGKLFEKQTSVLNRTSPLKVFLLVSNWKIMTWCLALKS